MKEQLFTLSSSTRTGDYQMKLERGLFKTNTGTQLLTQCAVKLRDSWQQDIRG